MSALIGSLRASLSLDSANFETGMKRAQRQAATSSSAISKSMGMMKAGIAGFVSGLSIGLIAHAIKNALDYAGSLGEVAQQLGVTTRELQTFRYAAQQNGASLEEADAALGKLSLSMSKALAGSKQAAAAYNAVGVSLDDLRTKSKSDILGQIADGMKRTGGASANAAAGVAIFGKGFQKIIPTLDQGSVGMNALSQAAEKLGIVISDENIQSADATADKLDALKTVLSASIANVVAANSNAILELANTLVSFVGTLGSALRAYQAFVAGMNIAGGTLQALDPTNSKKGRSEGRVRIAAGQMRLRDLQNQQRGGSSAASRAARFRSGLGIGAPKPTGAGGDISQFLKGGGGGGARKARGGGGADDAERKRQAASRDANQFASEMRRANLDILRAQQALAGDYVDRGVIAVQILEAERESYRAELEYEVASGAKTKAQAAQLLATNEITNSLEKQKVWQDMEEQRLEDVAMLENVNLDLKREQLERQAGLAKTQAERRQIELDILKIAYEQKRRALQDIIDQTKDTAARERARRELEALPAAYAADQQGAMQGTRGPLEDWAASVPQTTKQITEALQSIQAQGLDSLADGISDVVSGTKSLEDAFKDMAGQILADLARMIIKMLIFRALSSALGIKTGGITEGGALPARAFGGPVQAGRAYLVGEKRPEIFVPNVNGMIIPRVSHGQRIAAGSDGGQSKLVVEVQGSEMLTVHIREVSGKIVASAAPVIVAAAQRQTVRGMSRRRIS